MTKKKKVLFVDDNQMDRLILSKILEKLGLEFIGVASAEEFLPKIKEFNPDLCLIDLNIKRNNDGRILVRAIRNILGENLPIIIISAVEESEEIALNLKNGANDFICKPIDRSLLSSKISNYLHNNLIDSKILPVFQLPLKANAHIKMDFTLELLEIGENTVKVRTDIHLAIGSMICVHNNFLDQVFPEQKELTLKITERKGNEYVAAINELGEEDINTMRLFLTKLQWENH